MLIRESGQVPNLVCPNDNDAHLQPGGGFKSGIECVGSTEQLGYSYIMAVAEKYEYRVYCCQKNGFVWLTRPKIGRFVCDEYMNDVG